MGENHLQFHKLLRLPLFLLLFLLQHPIQKSYKNRSEQSVYTKNNGSWSLESLIAPSPYITEDTVFNLLGTFYIKKKETTILDQTIVIHHH